MIVDILKALSDETRLRMLNLLIEEELCVCEMEEILNINQSNASRHLEKLSNADLVVYEKRGKYIYYNINKETFERYPFLYSIIKDGLKDIQKFNEDKRRLRLYRESGISCDELKNGKLKDYEKK
ncbi:ArsR/SmtB family transcription factor [Thermovenabulum sp.]|uniref:ArsR/SmtB family transcription factor n=1 Tax=Thermovenabulum sp. TaxID=3100335 RepID=UPI003C7E3F33